MNSTTDTKKKSTTMKTPLISILIPCYNAQNFIDQCLETATKQTYKNIEILIMNDGSTDNSLKKLYEWKEKDDRIKIFSQLNAGVSKTRNELMKVSNGIYFSWLDIDDTLEYKSIEKLYKKSYEGKADIVVGRTNGVYNDGHLKLPYFPVWRRKKNMTNLQYVKSNICTPWASIIRREFFEKLDVNFFPGRVFEDIGLMPFIYLKAEVFVAINETTYNYHKYDIASKNISNFKEKSFLKRNDLLVITSSLFQKFKLEGWDRKKNFRTAINGIFFEILIANNILTNNFTSDVKIRKLLKYNAYKLLESFGWKLRFSKTPWKSLGYVYLRLSYIEFFRSGVIFKKTYHANFIDKIDEKMIVENSKKIFNNIYSYDKVSIPLTKLKNNIIEISEKNYIKNYKKINSSKLKYLLIKVENLNFNNFIHHLDYENINGITINSNIFDSRLFRDNENFLIINIEYEHVDEFSLKKLLNQLSQLNYSLRRPLIFLKCEWNKSVVRSTKSLVDLFIFINNDNNKIKLNNLEITDLIEIDKNINK